MNGQTKSSCKCSSMQEDCSNIGTRKNKAGSKVNGERRGELLYLDLIIKMRSCQHLPYIAGRLEPAGSVCLPTRLTSLI